MLCCSFLYTVFLCVLKGCLSLVRWRWWSCNALHLVCLTLTVMSWLVKSRCVCVCVSSKPRSHVWSLLRHYRKWVQQHLVVVKSLCWVQVCVFVCVIPTAGCVHSQMCVCVCVIPTVGCVHSQMCVKLWSKSRWWKVSVQLLLLLIWWKQTEILKNWSQTILGCLFKAADVILWLCLSCCWFWSFVFILL